MTKPWHPRAVRGGKPPKRNLVGQWDRHRWRVGEQQPRAKRRSLRLREFSLMIMFGLIGGVAISQWMSTSQPSSGPVEPVGYEGPLPDPYVETRRSRENLDAQAGPPVSLASAPAGGGDRENPALVRVIDGDTFDYRGMRVRVADIDTPERDGRCAEEIALAARATRRMRTLIAAGPFTLEPLPNGRDEDRYGRSLRIVTRGGRSLGDQLVAEGLARTWSGRREPWC